VGYLDIPLAIHVYFGCCENSKDLTDRSPDLKNKGVFRLQKSPAWHAVDLTDTPAEIAIGQVTGERS
jgi:hypothetical protein